MRYRQLWSGLLSLLITAGDGIAILAWSPLVTLFAVGLTSLFAFVVLEAFTDTSPVSDSPPRARVRSQSGRALTIGGGSTASVALIEMSPPVTLAILLLLGLTSPVVVARLGWSGRHRVAGTRHARTVPTADSPSGPPPLAADLVEDTLRSWDVTLLCHQLRRTYWALQETTEPGELVRLVTARQRIIDELAWRDPQAVTNWLHSGARASTSPEKYFTADPGTEQPEPPSGA